MMEHYVTLFNYNFLPQGLALYLSMDRHIKEYLLWILCVDDQTYDILSSLALSNIKLLKLSDLETEELVAIKDSRSIGEYCWTLTPYAPRFVFEAEESVARVTYIDADLWFRKSPKIIFEEFTESGKAVLITDHAYAAECDYSATAGQYCVQFLTFVRGGGECVRKWWQDRCIEWCFSRFEDGKFGDQKYLDDWPERFESHVHVLQNKELALAPWNATRFPFGNAVFYHFHGLRLISDKSVEVGNYSLPKTLVENVYRPYFQDLRNSLEILQKSGYLFHKQARSTSIARLCYRCLKNTIKKLMRFRLSAELKL